MTMETPMSLDKLCFDQVFYFVLGALLPAKHRGLDRCHCYIHTVFMILIDGLERN